MSSVNFLEKLLDGMDVEWRELGKIGDFVRGKRFVKTDIVSEGTPCIHYGELYTHFGIYARRTKSFLCENLASKLRFAQPGDVVIVSAGETIEDIGNATAWLGNQDVVIHDACFAFKSKLNPVYVSYFLRTKSFKDQIKKSISSGKISSINSSGLGRALIPIPCPDNPQKSLEIQAEIVHILDAMTAHTAELTAELTARKKQYNYYRDKLLSFENGDIEVDWKTLGDLGTWYGGGTPSKTNPAYWEDGTIPWISPKDMGQPIVISTEDYITEAAIKESSTKLIPANSIAIVVRSSILDKKLPSALIPIPATLNQDMKAIFPNDSVLPSYISHLIRSRGEDILRVARKSGGSVASIDSKKLFSFKVPIPSISEQNRIVALLDKFDTLANSISKGLPREIELREKQYAYYRDLLLSFPQAQTA